VIFYNLCLNHIKFSANSPEIPTVKGGCHTKIEIFCA
jgi:hypothetical protein